ncbi:MAG: Fur family transcriptional regulator [Gammaproteobacteria bacterium]|nr:Fur family transcriptional regulator [Gammaproteobacteria bacterium]
MHHRDHQTDSVSQELRAHGVIPTAQRLRIARMVLNRPAHFSAEQLYEQVNEDGARVSKATIYNTLGLFVEKGLLRQVLVDPSKVFYDSNMTPHHHFYDVESGELADIDADEIQIGALPDAGEGVEIEGVDVVIRVRRSANR